MSFQKSRKPKYHGTVDMEKHIQAIKSQKILKSQHEEGILKLTSKLDGRMVIVEVTAKAAEFVIGGGGIQLLKIEKRTGARLLSSIPEETSKQATTQRIEIMGSPNKCKKALDIIVAAADLYKQMSNKYNLQNRYQQQFVSGNFSLQRTQSTPATRRHAFVNQPLNFPSLSFGRAM